MKSFRVRRPWMLAMCSGAALALGIVTGHGDAALAGPVPPAGIETWGQEYEDHSSHAVPAPLPYPDEYSDEYRDYSSDSVEPEGPYGHREMLDACDWESATGLEDRIGQLGNAANFSHERDWENAPYEFGDGTTAELREVAMATAAPAVDAWDADISSPYAHGYDAEAEYADGYTMDSMDAAYGDGYTGMTSGEDEDQAVESSQDFSMDAWSNDDSYGEEEDGDEYRAGEMNGEAMDVADGDEAGEDADEGNAGEAEEETAQPVNEAGLDEARYDYPTESTFGDYDPQDYDSALEEFSDDSSRSDCSDEGLACDGAAEARDEASWGAYGYEYSYPQEKYGYSPEVSEVEPAKVDYEAEYDFDSRYEGEPGELIDYSQWKEPFAHECAEPGDCYGEYRVTASPLVESGLESFARHPRELLGISDQELLQTLELLCEEPSGTRRSILNDYLEGLGFVAIDFAARFEDVTGMESLSLADDLPGVAALLGCYRLVEQGELGMDEAVDLLRRTLEGPSEAWIEAVYEIAARSNEGRRGPVNAKPQASTGSTVLPGSVVRAVTISLQVVWGQIQGACLGAVDRLTAVEWEAWFSGLQSRLAEAREASAYDAF